MATVKWLMLLGVVAVHVCLCQPNDASLNWSNKFQENRTCKRRPFTVRFEGPLSSSEGISHANRDLVFALTLTGFRKTHAGNNLVKSANKGVLNLIDWCPACNFPKEHKTPGDVMSADITIRSLTWLPIMLPGLLTRQVETVLSRVYI